MSQYDAFSGAWEAVANSLAASMATNRVIVGLASQRSQKFLLPQLKDVVNWTDSMLVRTDDPELRFALVGAQGRRDRARIPHHLANPERHRSQLALGAAGDGTERAPAERRVVRRAAECRPGELRGLSADCCPNHPWTRMLASYLVGAPVRGYRDLAPHRYETYLVWDTAAVSRGVDVDLWVLEPDGNLYVPWLGVISPNGSMTGDSHDNDGYFEGYAMNRFVQAGRYKFYAHLYSDSNAVGTRVDLVYRTNPATAVHVAVCRRAIRRSRSRCRSAPTADTRHSPRSRTGQYSDVRYMAYWDVAPSGSPLLAPLSPGALDATPEDSELRRARDHTGTAEGRASECGEEKSGRPPQARAAASGLELRPR